MSARYDTTVHGAPAPATQSTHPWRTTARTLLQGALALAAAAPLLYQAVTGQDPAAATGAAATVLAVLAAVTRAMATPAVTDWLRRHAPALAPDSAPPTIGQQDRAREQDTSQQQGTAER